MIKTQPLPGLSPRPCPPQHDCRQEQHRQSSIPRAGSSSLLGQSWGRQQDGRIWEQLEAFLLLDPGWSDGSSQHLPCLVLASPCGFHPCAPQQRWALSSSHGDSHCQQLVEGLLHFFFLFSFFLIKTVFRLTAGSSSSSRASFLQSLLPKSSERVKY